MHVHLIFRFIGIIIAFLGMAMIIPLGTSFYYRDGSTNAFVYSIIICLAAGGFLYFFSGKNKEVPLNHRDGVAMVTFGWIAAGLAGAVPFLFSGTIPHFTDAYFESLSGFTTTGATILEHIEAVAPAILLWRSMTQWFGGMGIIVLSIAILPFLGVGGMQLYRAEVPSPVLDKLRPHISDTAKLLWKIYILITGLEIFFLTIGGMSFFESVCHSFSTMPTGGFSPKNASIAHYNNAYFDGVIIVFMVLAGINFSLHYKLIKGDFAIWGKDPEARVFLITVGLFIIITTLDLFGSVYDSLSQAFRYASFQVTSIITTTGFVTADYEQWPTFSQNLLFICMFLGAMAGSTGGGIKTMRVILLIKQGYREIFRIIHPHAVTTVKLGGRTVPREILSSIFGFFVLYLILYVTASMILASLGLDTISSFSSAAACIFNVGPGFGTVGPVDNYAAIPWLGKWVLIFCMLMGRLEIYTVIVLLMPAFWRK